MARPSFPGWPFVQRALGLAPTEAGKAVADDLAVEQFERIRKRLPSLYAVLALVGVAAMILTPAGIDPLTRFGLPLVLTVASLWRYAHWTRLRDVVIGVDESRDTMRRMLISVPVLIGLGTAWATVNFLDATTDERPLTIVLILLCSLAVASTAAPFPAIAALALVVGLTPITGAMVMKGDGGYLTVAATAWSVAAMTLRLAISELRDVTDNIVLRSQLRQQANTDPLTGIGNRRAFDAALAEVTQGGGSRDAAPALVMIDLDGFKGVNDRYGHGAGDELLKTVARRIVAVTPDHALVSRLGGDEFALLLRDTETAALDTLVARLRLDLSVPYLIAGERVRISASVGYARREGRLADAFYAAADAACYREKTGHREVRTTAA